MLSKKLPFGARRSMDNTVSHSGGEQLTQRELEILRLIADGLSNPEIAYKLFLTVGTVKVHTRNIYGKLDVSSRTQAIAAARTLNLFGEQPAAIERFAPL